MEKIIKIIKDKEFKLCMIYTFIIGIITHGYCYFNFFYSHDSLIMYQNDHLYQIGIGRIFHYFIFLIRGHYYVPSLVGFLSLLYLGISVYLIIKLFKINDKLLILLISGIMTTNISLILANATYLQMSDIYMLSLLFSILAAYFIRNSKNGYLLGIIFLILSLGLYQSYYQVCVFLLMVFLLKDIINKKDFKYILSTSIKYVLTLIFSLVIYLILVKLVQHFVNVNMIDAYNGLSSFSDYSGLKDIVVNFIRTYFSVIKYLFIPFTFNKLLVAIVNAFIVLLMAYYLVKIIINKKIRGWNLIFLLLIVALMPFGINLVKFLSHGFEHELMIYSFCFIYVLFIVLMKENSKVKNKYISLLLLVIIFSGVVYANECYYVKNLMYQNTLLTFNRIINRIELTDGYVPGETSVVFVGDLNESVIGNDYEFNDEVAGFVGNYSVTYYETLISYINNNLKYNMKVLDNNIIDNKKILDMEMFPGKNSIKIIDGILVVKLS